MDSSDYIDFIVAGYNAKSEIDVGRFHSDLVSKNNFDELAPVFILAYAKLRKSFPKKCILMYFLRRSRTYDPAVDLAISALCDRSALVVCEALAVLAYSLNQKASLKIAEKFNDFPVNVRGDAAAAIRAIQKKNHHFFWIEMKLEKFFGTLADKGQLYLIQ